MTQQQRHKTGNEFSDEGARALSEALKFNTTLQTLDLESVKQQSHHHHHNNNNNSEYWQHNNKGTSRQ